MSITHESLKYTKNGNYFSAGSVSVFSSAAASSSGSWTLGDDLAGRIEQPIGRHAGDPGIAGCGKPALRPGQIEPFQRRLPGRGIIVEREAEHGQPAGGKSFLQVAASAGSCCLHGPHQLAQKCTTV